MGLSVDEMSQISIGQALDFMAEYVEASSPKDRKEKRGKVRMASQADFDAF
jgi:hypothetical protein